MTARRIGSGPPAPRAGVGWSSGVGERLALAVIAVVSAGVVLGVAVLLLGQESRAGGAVDVSGLPALNAALNATSAALLAAGYAFIRRRRIRAHLACMLTAFGVSTLFLVSYVIYHYYAGSRPFTAQGWIRPVYFTLLVSHIVLAAAIVPLALITIWRAVTGRFVRHMAIARWTLPIWLYVSVTGVVIYWMLYRL